MATMEEFKSLLSDRLKRDKKLQQGQPAYTFGEDVGLFFKSAGQSLGEMIGIDASPDVTLWRGYNPGLGFVSELITPLGVYGGVFKATKAIKGFDAAVKGFGASFKSPFVGGAAAEIARWAPFELGRVGASALVGGDIGDTAESAAFSLLIEGSVGGIGKLIKAAGKVDRNVLDTIERKFNSPPQLIGRAILEAKQSGKLAENFNTDIELLRYSQRVRSQDAPVFVAPGQQKAMDNYVRKLEIGDGQELNRLYRGSMKEVYKQKIQAGPGSGFFKTDDEWKQLLSPLGLKDGWEFFAQFPRVFSFSADNAAKNFYRRLTHNTQSLGNGWWMAKEADDGMFVLGARLPGATKVGKDDKWLLFKTDSPEFFLGKHASFANKMAKEEAWHMVDDLDEIRKYANEPVIGHGIQLMDTFPKEAMSPLLRSNNPSESWAKAIAKKFGGKFAKESSGFFNQLNNFGREFLAPAIHQFGRNARARYSHAIAKSIFDKARGLSEETLLGKFTFGQGKNLGRSFLQGTQRQGGLIDQIKNLTNEDLGQLQDVLTKQLDAAAVAAAGYSPAVQRLTATLEPLAEDLLRQINSVRKMNGERQIKALKGHMTLTMTWRGDHRVPIMQGGKLVYVASGRTAKEAEDEADAIIRDMLAQGKEWVRGKHHLRGEDLSASANDVNLASAIDLKSTDFALANASRARFQQTQRGQGGGPQFLKTRSGVGGSIQDTAISKEELGDIVKDYVDSVYKYVAEGTTRKLLNGHLAALATEDPTLFRALIARIDDMAGRPGPIGKITNDIADKALGRVLGKNSASKIVSNINRLMFSLQLGSGNLAFGIMNMMTFIQTGLPEIAFALNASKESLGRYYTYAPLLGKNTARGYVGSMNPLKLWRESFRAMGNPDAEMRKLVDRAAGDGVIEPRMIQEFMGTDSRMAVTLKEAFSSKEGMYNGVMQLSEFIPKRTERWARGNSFVTGVLVGRELGLVDDGLYLFAKEFTDRTMFRYAMEDKSRIFTGALGSAFGLFKNWQMHFTYNLLDYLGEGFARGNWKPLLWLTASSGAMGGVAAVPFYTVANGLSKWFTDESIMTHVYDMFGQGEGENNALADGVMMGLPAMLPQLLGLPGVSFAGSSAAPMSDPSRDAQLLFSFVYWDRGKALAQAIGSGIDHYEATGKSPFDSMDVRRQLSRALAPKTIYRLAQQGMDGTINSLSTGYPTMKGITFGEGLLYTLGFTPERVDGTYRVMDELWRSADKKKAEMQALGKAYAVAVERGDQSEQYMLLMQAVAQGHDVSGIIRSANSRLIKGREGAIARQFDPQIMRDRRLSGALQLD